MQRLVDIFNNLDRHCGKFEHYFDIYERHFGKFVDKKPVIVEVGICRGGSAEMWQKYFGEGATIVGIDVDIASFREEIQTPGCIQVKGDQGSPQFWDQFLKEYPKIDILLDDGGHHMSQQILTLQKVWPHITDGGVFMCEDTHTSYWPEYRGGLRNPQSFQEYAKSITDTMNSQYWKGNDASNDNKMFADFFKDLDSQHFYDSVVAFEKRAHPIPQLITSTPI
jgi:cephalosporin hydroxylase